MTREEAVARIKNHIEIHRYNERNAVKIFEALNMAIKALEQPEPCEDAVSREAVLEVFMENADRGVLAYTTAWRNIKDLPSVTPKQDWIPVSEGMPEEREWVGTKQFGTTISDEVYVTFEAPNGERFVKHLSFQNGKVPSFKQREIDVWFGGATPVAWKPLPEPYQPDAK